MDIVVWVLALVWDVVCWVWWLSPVHISLVLLAALCGFVAVLLVPRETKWLPVVTYWRRAVPWAAGHDPDEAVQYVEVAESVGVPSGDYSINVVSLFERKAA
ncbi:hypothetical protein [Pseudonocardia oroxyli]|uniref:Uncharacterized protein n=1 Tax=Pseudonocardia oroxyli TaxID=366584 RepID=A0A1G7UM72_PSEOR|nr:hypothetical protein [Pseudonocardia oroxyli]SDG48606.1 hypothetical protein SAMN05216377_11289 [Pseudonocardia oroxyli]